MRHASDVLLLSRITGRDVVGSDGNAVGRLADLTVALGRPAGPRLVERVIVTRGHAAPLVLCWDAVANLQSGRVVLGLCAGETAAFEVGSVAEVLGEDEILLGRDVLDTQVVDVVGQRLARVADVVMARTPEARLEVLGVEVGFGGVLRRLGLGSLVTRSTTDVVAWSDLHLTSEHGQAVQLAAPRAAVHRLDPRSLAALVSRVDTESATQILVGQDPAVAAAAVREVHPDIGERVLRALPEIQADRIVGAMPAEHALRWRDRLARRPTLLGRRFLRSGVWPRRRHLIRGRRR